MTNITRSARYGLDMHELINADLSDKVFETGSLRFAPLKITDLQNPLMTPWPMWEPQRVFYFGSRKVVARFHEFLEHMEQRAGTPKNKIFFRAICKHEHLQMAGWSRLHSRCHASVTIVFAKTLQIQQNMALS